VRRGAVLVIAGEPMGGMNPSTSIPGVSRGPFEPELAQSRDPTGVDRHLPVPEFVRLTDVQAGRNA
jgi:hypothetical protein